jgi:hypothetical protein
MALIGKYGLNELSYAGDIGYGRRLDHVILIISGDRPPDLLPVNLGPKSGL